LGESGTDVEVGEQELGALAGEELEAALRVPHIGHAERHQRVERSSEELPEEGPLRDSFVLLLKVVTRAHGDTQPILFSLRAIGLSRRPQRSRAAESRAYLEKAPLEPLKVFKLGGAIGVYHQHILASGHEHAL
jgi:hypothetical protein